MTETDTSFYRITRELNLTLIWSVQKNPSFNEDGKPVFSKNRSFRVQPRGAQGIRVYLSTGTLVPSINRADIDHLEALRTKIETFYKKANGKDRLALVKAEDTLSKEEENRLKEQERAFNDYAEPHRDFWD